MAPCKWKCLAPGSSYETEEDCPDEVEFLKLHTSLNHGVTTKPEKPQRPELLMTGDMVEGEFVFKYELLACVVSP